MFRFIAAILTVVFFTCGAHAQTKKPPAAPKKLPEIFHGIWQQVEAGKLPSCKAKDAALRETVRSDGVETPEGFCRPIMVNELSRVSIRTLLACKVDRTEKYRLEEWQFQKIGNQLQLFVRGFDPSDPDNERFKARCKSVEEDKEEVLPKIAQSAGPAKDANTLCYFADHAELFISPEGDGYEGMLETKGSECMFLGDAKKSKDGFVIEDSVFETGCKLSVVIDDKENVTFRASAPECSRLLCEGESSFETIRFAARDRFPCRDKGNR